MKKLLIMVLAMMLPFFLGGCKDKGDSTAVQSNENSMVDIYYPEDNNVVKLEDKYQIKQPDSISASVEEIMLQLMEKLDERMEYHTYLIDADNNVTLQFVCNREYNKEYLLLAKAAIVETLFQIEDINSVTIKISDAAGNVIADNLFLRNSFYFYE